MEAFHGKESIKKKYLERVMAHAKADEIIKGTYWEDGKGCAVGCTIHGSDHSKYETELGIPEWLARVEDTIFEGLPNKRAKIWPQEFLESVNIGSDLEKIKIPFLIFIVESVIDKFDHEKFPKVKESIDQVLDVLRNNPNDKVARAAAGAAAGDAAGDAGDAAGDAAGAAAGAAAWAAAGDAARAAAWAAAGDAAGAAAGDAAGDAGDAAYEKFADKLLYLLKDCK